MLNRKSVSFSLLENQTISIDKGSKVKLKCSAGQLWVTGVDGKDIIVGENDAVTLTAAAKIVVQGVKPSKLSLCWM